MHICGVRIHSPRHSASCYQQIRARRTLLIAPTALEATHAKVRPKLHRFVLSPSLLQTCLFNIYTTNRLSGVWALSFKYAVNTISRCAINRRSLPVIILGMQCNKPMVDFYRATLCMPWSCICPSVCLSVRVCLSHFGIVWKRLNVGSHK